MIRNKEYDNHTTYHQMQRFLQQMQLLQKGKELPKPSFFNCFHYNLNISVITGVKILCPYLKPWPLYMFTKKMNAKFEQLIKWFKAATISLQRSLMFQVLNYVRVIQVACISETYYIFQFQKSRLFFIIIKINLGKKKFKQMKKR